MSRTPQPVMAPVARRGWRSPFAAVQALVARAVSGVVAWWAGLDPSERVLYRAMVLLAIGCGAGFGAAFAFIVPGVLFALVFFGFSLRRAT